MVERPQHMFMRVAVAIHGADIDRAIETYNLMSMKYFIHASPTLFHAGTTVGQLSSCYLLPLRSAELEGMYQTLTECALISRSAGRIGFSIHNAPASGYGYIFSTYQC